MGSRRLRQPTPSPSKSPIQRARSMKAEWRPRNFRAASPLSRLHLLLLFRLALRRVIAGGSSVGLPPIRPLLRRAVPAGTRVMVGVGLALGVAPGHRIGGAAPLGLRLRGEFARARRSSRLHG